MHIETFRSAENYCQHIPVIYQLKNRKLQHILSVFEVTTTLSFAIVETMHSEHSFKGIVLPKMKILSLITHPHVGPNP